MEQVKTELKTVSIKNLVTHNIIDSIGKLAINVNGYGFVTILNDKRKAANLYFTKDLSPKVIDTFGVGNNLPKEFVENLIVIASENNDGEQRFKLYDNSDSKYTSLSDMFGAIDKNFPMEDFKREWHKGDLIEKPQEQEETASAS